MYPTTLGTCSAILGTCGLSKFKVPMFKLINIHTYLHCVCTFSTFGTVEDVRIPCQQKRMFGFVTFASANTVRTVLAKGNPHFVCGSRVLVKPYREKSKLNERLLLSLFSMNVTTSFNYMYFVLETLSKASHHAFLQEVLGEK